MLVFIRILANTHDVLCIYGEYADNKTPNYCTTYPRSVRKKIRIKKKKFNKDLYDHPDNSQF